MTALTTYAGATISICTTAQPTALDQTAFAALTYVQIKKVRNSGEWSSTDNILSYDTLDDTVTQKQKGTRNGGDPTIELAYVPSDAGQDAIRAAAETRNYYAFKRTLADGTVQYNRGVVGGPERPGGGVEDFAVERFTLGFVQSTIVVEPA